MTTTTAEQLTQGSLRLRPSGPLRWPESASLESTGREQAGECTVFTFAQYQAAHGSVRYKFAYPNLPGRFRGLHSSVVSAADDSESHVYGDGDCGTASRYSRASKTEAPGAAQSGQGAASSSGRAACSQSECGQVVCARGLRRPKPKPRQIEAELPKVNETFQPLKLEMAANQPARPREPVKTGMMTGGSSAVPTIANKPIEKVQTGGFGDPDGLTGPSDPNKRANIGHFGNPALPPGPGYGNGTGGANGARGMVASTGFGNGVAIPPTGPAARRRSTGRRICQPE